jgi:hypothetical protein
MNAILTASPVPGVAPGLYTHVIGDAACRVPPQQAQALGCTGFEGFAIGGGPDPADACTGAGPFNNICDNFSAGAYAAELYGGYGSSSLAPGDPTSYFCQDPSLASQDLGNCVDGPVWTNALQAVTSVAGLGNPAVLPWQLKDRRYYFRWWGISMIRYYMAYGANSAPWNAGVAGLTYAALQAQPLDLTSLFFDEGYGGIGGSPGAFDTDEYIVRGNALPGGPSYVGTAVQSATSITGQTPNGTSTPPTVTVPTAVSKLPMDFTYGSDTIGANQRYTNWYKRMDREEAGMFQAMLVTKTDLLGSENDVNITNLAGSPLLAASYASYECATQWPNVTIAGAGITDMPWASVCQLACPALPTIPGVCPFPPGIGTDGEGNPGLGPLAGDQNGTPAFVPAAGSGEVAAPQVNALAGGLVAPYARLAAYPSVWGGTGAFCVGSGDGEEGDSYNATNNPFLNMACGGSDSMTASQHGSVFKVGSTDKNNARIQFLKQTGVTTPTPQTGAPVGNIELQQAFINIPNMANPQAAKTIFGSTQGPFNSNTHVGKECSASVTTNCITPGANGSTPLTGASSINVSVPWNPNQEGNGFQIPLTGTTGKFVQTASLDFTGVLESYVVDYEPWTDPDTGAMDGTIKIDAIEGEDYLGEVFLCQDLGTSGTASGDFLGTQDLLGVHMYDTGGEVLVWLTNHPGVQNACGVVVQYSEYNNYLNYIASLSAGVAVGITQGAGYGRISNVWIFDPAIAQIP